MIDASRQIAMCATEFRDIVAEEAKKRQREHGGTAPGKNTYGGTTTSDDSGKTSEILGKQFGVGEKTVREVSA